MLNIGDKVRFNTTAKQLDHIAETKERKEKLRRVSKCIDNYRGMFFRLHETMDSEKANVSPA